MLNEIVANLEKYIDTDDFEYEMQQSIEKLVNQEIGIEAVEPLLLFMERHPMSYFGMPGAIVHFVEGLPGNDYEVLLVESIKRRPTLHTVWMLNRVINGSHEPDKYIDLMREIVTRTDIEEAIKAAAEEFLE